MKASRAMPGLTRAIMPKMIARIPRTRNSHQWLRSTCTAVLIIRYLLFLPLYSKETNQPLHKRADLRELEGYTLRRPCETESLIYSIIGLFLLCKGLAQQHASLIFKSWLVQVGSGHRLSHTWHIHGCHSSRGHHDIGAHHVMVLVFQQVAMVHEAPCEAIESGGNRNKLTRVDPHCVFPAHLVRIERPMPLKEDR